MDQALPNRNLEDLLFVFKVFKTHKAMSIPAAKNAP